MMRRAVRRGSRSRMMVLVACAVLSAGLGACTGEDAEGGGADEPAGDALDLGAAPSADAVLPADRGEPPAGLETEDLVEGSGEVVGPGDVLTVDYLGWRWSDGGEFASSWGPGEPLRFELGAQEVIPGWEQGILGHDQQEGPLRVGGRRVLVIPPELAYGERGAGAAIGADETLVFVIDLVAIDDDIPGSHDAGPDGAGSDDAGPDDPTDSEQAHA